jgi:hypothetical protein
MTVSVTAVNVGTAPADGTGDPARTAFTKLNANDVALAAAINALGLVGGFNYVATVADYASLPTGLGTGDENSGWVVAADGLVYVWDGSAFPADGSGAPFQGPPGADSTVPGPAGPPSTTVPPNVQTGASYNVAGTDAGLEIQMSNAGANIVYLSDNILAPNTIALVRQIGSGQTTVASAGQMQIVPAGPSLNAAQQGSLMYIRAQSATLAYVGGEVALSGNTPNIAIAVSLPDGTTGTAYTGYVHGTNSGGATGTITYAADVLPAGLSISSTTGNITGTPTTAQTVNTTFTVTNGTQTVHPTHTFNVVAAAVPGITVSMSLPNGNVGSAYSGSISATNVNGATGAITFSADHLPAGLSLGAVTVNGNTYTQPITGTPTTAATTNTTFTVGNGTQTATPNPTNSFVIGAAVTVPTFVRYSHNESTVIPATLAVTLSGTPSAGHLLVASYGGYSTHPPTTPAGFTLLLTKASGTQQLWVFTKVADGTETVVNFAATASTTIYGCAAGVTEWANSKTGATSSLSTSFSAGVATVTKGPSSAPVSANSLPLNLLYLQLYDPVGISLSSPWTGEYHSANANNSGISYATQPAPNTAVSITYTRGTTTAGSAGVFVSVWIDPA